MEEGDNTALRPPFFHPSGGPAASSAGRNGLFSGPPPSSSSPPAAAAEGGGGPGAFLLPHSALGRASSAFSVAPAEPARRKRGRPRKYGPSPSPSVSASASPLAKGSPSLLPPSSSASSPRKRGGYSSSKKAQLAALGNGGMGFTPLVIMVASGEDVCQKIMAFVQQRKRAFCILSASGSISTASLSQTAVFGGCVTYEGRYEILSLSGSFLLTEADGASSRTGGLSVCLSGADGRVIGGGIAGPLLAAGPVQVIAFSFLIETNGELSAANAVDHSTSRTPIQSQTSAIAPITFRSISDSTLRMATSRVSCDTQNAGGSGSNYMLQSQGMHMMPPRSSTEWRGRREADFRGVSESPDDEDEEVN